MVTEMRQRTGPRRCGWHNRKRTSKLVGSEQPGIAAMADEYTQTVRIARPSKVRTDERGRTVWSDPVEDVELELVTTQMLKNVLESNENVSVQQIRESAADNKEGLLAHDPKSGRFKIVSDDELEAALRAASEPSDSALPADVQFDPVEELRLSLQVTESLEITERRRRANPAVKAEHRLTDVC